MKHPVMTKWVDVGKRRVFKEAQTADKIHELSYKNFSDMSKKKMLWVVNLFNDWRINRMKQVLVERQIRDTDLAFVNQFSEGDLAYCLCRFICEIKKIDGDDYPPNTLREIVIMIQMYLHQNGLFWKLLDGEEFIGLRNVLDNTMKERHALGLGVRESCTVITVEKENELFACGALGEENPEQLLRTVIYLMGLHLALRGGVEYTRLRRPGFNCQIVTEVDESTGKEMLIYREDPLQKTNPGGVGCKTYTESCKGVCFK